MSADEFVELLRISWGSTSPTDVITFCLSDIEGSTALWDSHPESMAGALARHDELIADAVQTNGGRLVKSMGEGDSTVSVFDSASQAFAAAVAANAAIAAEPWPDGIALRVRFALHTGDAEKRGDDYFGSTVNLAARLRAQADGGQVFLSSTTAGLIAPALPEDFRLVDLGLHRLRGFRAPESVWALDGPGVEAPPPGTDCPYRGLLSFEASDRGLYFGREDVVGDLIARVARGGLVAVVGASGSGKSSLIRAGLVAAVEAGEVAGIERADLVTPSANRALPDHSDGSTVLVVDQFEELFTGYGEPAERQAFVERLLAFSGPKVVGVRADVYGELGAHPELATAVAANHILLGAMTSDELRRAITEPARLAGLRLAPGLVDLVLADVADEPGALPLLSHALRATWEERDGRTLTVEAYQTTGGVQSAIATTADAVLASLPSEQQGLLRDVLLRLTELGEGVEDARRRVPLAELVPAESSLAPVRGLLERLADARLVTLGEGTAEVAHEALIREWPTLRSWLQEDRAALQLHRRVSNAARLWGAGGREASDLYRGTRLEAAREWAASSRTALNATERAFLDASVKEQARSHHRLRRLLTTTAVLLVISVIAGIVAFNQRGQARERAREATIQRIAAQSLAIGPDDMPTSALFAVEAARREDSAETRSALIGSLEVAPQLLRYFTEPARSDGAVALSADGSFLGVSHAGRVEFYDADTLEPAYEPIVVEGASDVAIDVAFDLSADGRFAAISGPDQAVERWAIREHRRLGRIELPAPWTERNDIAISPDGRSILLAVSAEGEKPAVIRLDATMAVVAGPSSVGRYGFPEAHFCGDGSSVIVGTDAASGEESDLIRLRADTLEPLGPPTVLPGTPLGRLKCARGSGVASFPTTALAATIDVDTGELLGSVPVRAAIAVQATPDGKTLLVLEDGGALGAYNITTGEQRDQSVETGFLRGDLVIAPDGRAAFVGGSRVAEVSLDGSTPLGPIAPGTRGASRVSQNVDGSTLAVVVGLPGDPVTRFVDRASGRVVETFPGYAQYLPDGRSILTLDDGGVAGVGTLHDPGSRWRRKVTEPGLFFNHELSDDGTLLGVTSGVGRLRVIDAATGDELGSPIGGGDEPPVFAFAFSPDNRLLGVYRSFSDTIDFHDPRTGKPSGAPISMGRLTGGPLVFTPDGEQLLISQREGPISIGDAATRRLGPTQLNGHSSRITDAVFLSDGLTLVTAGVDKTVRMWDLEARLPLGRPLPFAFARANATDSASGVLHRTAEGVLIPSPAGVIIADLRPETLIDRACERAGRNLPATTYAQYLPSEDYNVTCPRYPAGS